MDQSNLLGALGETIGDFLLHAQIGAAAAQQELETTSTVHARLAELEKQNEWLLMLARYQLGAIHVLAAKLGLPLPTAEAVFHNAGPERGAQALGQALGLIRREPEPPPTQAPTAADVTKLWRDQINNSTVTEHRDRSQKPEPAAPVGQPLREVAVQRGQPLMAYVSTPSAPSTPSAHSTRSQAQPPEPVPAAPAAVQPTSPPPAQPTPSEAQPRSAASHTQAQPSPASTCSQSPTTGHKSATRKRARPPKKKRTKPRTRGCRGGRGPNSRPKAKPPTSDAGAAA